jgi:hypothetical protein
MNEVDAMSIEAFRQFKREIRGSGSSSLSPALRAVPSKTKCPPAQKRYVTCQDLSLSLRFDKIAD